jgi:hypothetical protein
MATNTPNSLWWWVAPSHYQAGIGFDRVRSMVPPKMAKINLATRTIVLPNGATIEFKTGDKPNLLFGAAVNGAVFDEASRVKQEAWTALMTTLAQTRGPVRVASNTDRGKSNWFFGLYCRGLDPAFPDYASWSMKSHENPYNPPELAADLRAALPESAYQALVEAEFPDDALTVFRGIRTAPPIDLATLPRITEPRNDTAYTIGVDLAKKRDYTVITTLDSRSFDLAYWRRFSGVMWETQMEVVASVSRDYNRALTLVDSTGVGDPIFERLQLMGTNVEGYQFTSASKQRLINKLALGIEAGDVRIPENLDVLLAELRGYEYGVSSAGAVQYQTPHLPGHADAVISLALAYWAAANPFAVGYAGAPRDGASVAEQRRWKDRGRGF